MLCLRDLQPLSLGVLPLPLSGHGFIYQAAGFEEPRPSLYRLDRWYLVLWHRQTDKTLRKQLFVVSSELKQQRTTRLLRLMVSDRPEGREEGR